MFHVHVDTDSIDSEYVDDSGLVLVLFCSSQLIAVSLFCAVVCERRWEVVFTHCGNSSSYPVSSVCVCLCVRMCDICVVLLYA